MKPLKFTDNFVNHEDLILRDYLALQRTKLANERTLFTYIRTSLYLLTVGVGILEIKSIEHLRALAFIGFFSSALLLLIGLLKYNQLRKQLNSYMPAKTPPDSTGKDHQ